MKASSTARADLGSAPIVHSMALRKNECGGRPPCPPAAEALVPCGSVAIGGETQ